jgi:dTDP-4-dehydrorhamnose reductase
MNILIIGRSGQLAAELVKATWPGGMRVVAMGRDQLDIADAAAVARVVAATMPDIIVNAAAYTAVDRAESDRASAFAINHLGPQYLAEAAARQGAALIHVSTDYVFSGAGATPWREGDEPQPRSVYGQSKLAGERAVAAILSRHVILRTSWLFAAHGQNFVRTMLRLGNERDRLTIVDDQRGCPTAAADLARVIVKVATALSYNQARFGLYHYAGRGAVTWYQFAEAIFALADDLVTKAPLLVPISTADFAAAAPRPAFSVLDCTKIEQAYGITQTDWRDALSRVLGDIRATRLRSDAGT